MTGTDINTKSRVSNFVVVTWELVNFSIALLIIVVYTTKNPNYNLSLIEILENIAIGGDATAMALALAYAMTALFAWEMIHKKTLNRKIAIPICFYAISLVLIYFNKTQDGIRHIYTGYYLIDFILHYLFVFIVFLCFLRFITGRLELR